MSDPLVAVGIGNTTITFGVIAAAGESANGDSALGGSARGNSTPDKTDLEWSLQFTVETSGFDPAAVALRLPTRAAWRVASVHRPSEKKLADWVRRSHEDAAYRSLAAADLPLKACLEQPDRVGMDRLVAAVAVNELRDPRRPAVIVDAGTAITVDLVNREGDFLGGAILPGMRLVAQALATETDQLPLVDPRFHQSLPQPLGTATEGAIRSGLFWGSVGAVRELVQRIGAVADGQPQVFLTGGDAERLTPYVTPEARFIKDLVLRGILAAGP